MATRRYSVKLLSGKAGLTAGAYQGFNSREGVYAGFHSLNLTR
jgi:hypothetical protein